MPEFLSNATPLMVFLGIAALGFVFLLISLVVGDIFDSFGFDTGLDGVADGHALLDSRVISVFVTAFGGFGAIGIQMGLSIVASSLLGLGGGIILGGVVSLFGRLLYKQQATSSVTTSQLIGRPAQVTVSIAPGSLGQVQRFDTKPVPGERDDTGFAVGDRERGHAREAGNTADSPPVERLDDHLAVCGREESIARSFEFPAQVLVVIDAPVENQRQPQVAVHHRLGAAGGQVDDRQSPVTERDRTVREYAVGVRAARRHRSGHPGDGGDVRRLAVPTYFAADATHIPVLPTSSPDRLAHARRPKTAGYPSVSTCPCCHRRTTS